jgi:hypothetical protein
MKNESLLNDLKKKVISRKRAVVFDNDGGDVASLCRGTTDQELIETRTRPALDAGIDTYIYTTGWGFGIGLHDSKVGSVLRTKEGHLSKNLTRDFIREDTDCLRITSEYVNKTGTEFYWGMRMNDTHDAGYGNVFMPENTFKNENPEVLFGKDIRHGAVTAVDYLNEKVRAFALAYIMDVVDRYEVDGIFLDFFRHPIFFRSNAHGLPATSEEREAMNDFMSQLKTELDKRRLAAGKYFLVSVRVPDSVEYCNAIGLDLNTWFSNGLADILFTTSYIHLNNWNYSAEIAHKHQIPVYPSLDETRVKSEIPRHKRNSVRGYYGRIMNVWNSDCDGIFMFNNSGLRDMKQNIEQNWSRIDAGTYQEGLAATVKGKDFVNTLSKTYFVSFRGVGAVAGDALPHLDYINIPTLNHFAPISILKETEKDVVMLISDDINAAVSKGMIPKATVSIHILDEPDSVDVSLNAMPLKLTAAESKHTDLDNAAQECVLTGDLPIQDILCGENVFRFQTTGLITLLDLWVDMEYPDI